MTQQTLRNLSLKYPDNMLFLTFPLVCAFVAEELKCFMYKPNVCPGLQKDGNGGNVFPANLRFWQPLLASQLK